MVGRYGIRTAHGSGTESGDATAGACSGWTGPYKQAAQQTHAQTWQPKGLEKPRHQGGATNAPLVLDCGSLVAIETEPARANTRFGMERIINPNKTRIVPTVRMQDPRDQALSGVGFSRQQHRHAAGGQFF